MASTQAIQLADLDHVVLRVSDLEMMTGFYCRVLACEIAKRTSDELGMIHLRAGRAMIDLVSIEGRIGRRGGAAPGAEGRNMDHVCLRLEHFDEASIREHLSGHGVEAGEVVNNYGARGYGPSLYLQDPEGNTIELKGPAATDEA